MKLRFNLLLVVSLFGFAEYALSQSATLAGFVFANAVGIQEKADITANGKKLTSNGVAAGIASSGLGLPVGNYQLLITAPGCEPASLPVQLIQGACPVVVAYLERIRDPKTNTIKNYIRVLQLPATPQTEKFLITAVSVDPTSSLIATVSGQAKTLEFKKPVSFDGKRIKVTDSSGFSDETYGDEKGSYYCFAFRKVDGKVATILVPERIYQW